MGNRDENESMNGNVTDIKNRNLVVSKAKYRNTINGRNRRDKTGGVV
jgi:hypothetical protein